VDKEAAAASLLTSTLLPRLVPHTRAPTNDDLAALSPCCLVPLVCARHTDLRVGHFRKSSSLRLRTTFPRAYALPTTQLNSTCLTSKVEHLGVKLTPPPLPAPKDQGVSRRPRTAKIFSWLVLRRNRCRFTAVRTRNSRNSRALVVRSSARTYLVVIIFLPPTPKTLSRVPRYAVNVPKWVELVCWDIGIFSF